MAVFETSTLMSLTKDYKVWLGELKGSIQGAQIKAALKVNAELLNLYLDLGQEILAKESQADWGDKLIPQLSKDLLAAFPEMKSFSRTNLFYIRKWMAFYTANLSSSIVPQVVGQFGDTDSNSEIGKNDMGQKIGERSILPEHRGRFCAHSGR